jgi:hypothetical protein
MKGFELLLIFGFIILFCYFPDIDYLTLAKKYHINNTIFALFLIVLAGIGIYTLKINKGVSALVFIIFFMLMKTRFTYVELFGNQKSLESFVNEFSVSSQTPDPNATEPLLVAQELQKAQEFLKKQIQSDPNKTQMEKQVIDDIINHYFVKSDKLKQLSNFNIASQVANPIAGDQKLTPDF